MAKTLPPMLEVMKEVAGVDILPSITGGENKEAAPAEASVTETAAAKK